MKLFKNYRFFGLQNTHKLKSSYYKRKKIDKYFFGINRFLVKTYFKKLGFTVHIHFCKTTYKHINLLERIIKKDVSVLVAENLSIFIKDNIQNLFSARLNKGLRHERNLPVRGQRTRTNAKTSKKKNGFVTKMND